MPEKPTKKDGKVRARGGLKSSMIEASTPRAVANSSKMRLFPLIAERVKLLHLERRMK